MKFTWKEILSTTFLILIISSIFAYAAIQSEVGINLYDYTNGIWRRQRSGSTAGDGVSTTTQGNITTQSFLMGLDTLNGDWDRLEAGTNSTDGQAVDDGNNRRSLLTLSRNTVFNGTTWDRVLSSTHGPNLTTARGINTASFTYFYDGTDWDRAFNTAHADATGTSTGLNVAGYNYLYNGTTWDRQRSAQTTLLATTMTTGVTPSALYAYDNQGTSANTYRAINILAGSLRSVNNISGVITNITTNTDTLIDSGTATRMMLYKIIVGVGGTASTIVIKDEADGAVPCGGTTVGTLTTTTPLVFDLGIIINNDICLTTAGTAAANIMVTTEVDTN